MAKNTGTKKEPLEWLLETENPGVRYLALRELVKAGGVEFGQLPSSLYRLRYKLCKLG
jgi:hypothetical protein